VAGCMGRSLLVRSLRRRGRTWRLSTLQPHLDLLSSLLSNSHKVAIMKLFIYIIIIWVIVAGIIGSETLASNPQQSLAGVILAYVIPFIVIGVCVWLIDRGIYWAVYQGSK